MQRKSLAQIEFELRHDLLIRKDYCGPVIMPDGNENTFCTARRSKMTGWSARGLNEYRNPTDEEIKLLAKIKYERLHKIDAVLQSMDNLSAKVEPESESTADLRPLKQEAINYKDVDKKQDLSVDDYIKQQKTEGATDEVIAYELYDKNGCFRLTHLEICRKLDLGKDLNADQIGAMKKRGERACIKGKAMLAKNEKRKKS